MLPAAKRRKNKPMVQAAGEMRKMNKPRRGERNATTQAPEDGTGSHAWVLVNGEGAYKISKL